MRFKVCNFENIDKTTVENITFLIPDAWDDWFKFDTRFRLYFMGPGIEKEFIGSLKIGQKGLAPGSSISEKGKKMRWPEIPSDFFKLNDDFFSVGMSDGYYEALNALGEKTKTEILIGLRDFSFDSEIFVESKTEPVTQSSLLRDIDEERVTGRFRRLSH